MFEKLDLFIEKCLQVGMAVFLVCSMVMVPLMFAVLFLLFGKILLFVLNIGG